MVLGHRKSLQGRGDGGHSSERRVNLVTDIRLSLTTNTERQNRRCQKKERKKDRARRETRVQRSQGESRREVKTKED